MNRYPFVLWLALSLFAVHGSTACAWETLITQAQQGLDAAQSAPNPLDDAALLIVTPTASGFEAVIQVQDSRVVDPNLQGGWDEVEFFLDLRTGEDYRDANYGPGVWRWLVPAPASREPSRLPALQRYPSPPEATGPTAKVDALGRRSDGGYYLRLEVRLDDPGRLKRPFGIAFLVRDMDGPLGTAIEYSLDGQRNLRKRPNRFRERAATDPDNVAWEIGKGDRGFDLILTSLSQPPGVKPKPSLRATLKPSPFDNGFDDDRHLELPIVRTSQQSFPLLDRVVVVAKYALPADQTGRMIVEDSQDGPGPDIYLGGDQPELVRRPRGEDISALAHGGGCLNIVPVSYYPSAGLPFSFGIHGKGFPGAGLWALSESARAGQPCQGRFQLLDRQGKIAWSTTVPLTIQAFASKGQTVEIPASAANPGVHELRADFFGPTGQTMPAGVRHRYHDPWGGQDLALPASARLDFLPAPVEAIEAREQAGGGPPQPPRVLGNPARASYPDDTAKHAYARSVLDLQWHDGRLWIAGGDYQDNQGPFVIRSWSPAIGFQDDCITDDEAIEQFRVEDGVLYAPGADARESWEFGNLYVRKPGGQWLKKRTLPNAVHVFDVRIFRRRLYAACGTSSGAALFYSGDGGDSWTRVPFDDLTPFGRFYEIMPGDQGLLLGPRHSERQAWFFDGRNIAPSFTAYTPALIGLESARIRKSARWAGGTLYTLRMGKESDPAPLYFLKSFGSAARPVSLFLDRKVADIVVPTPGVEAHVLSYAKDHLGYSACIHSANRPTDWRLAFAGSFHAIPCSLEVDAFNYYVGLGAFHGQNKPDSGKIVVVPRETNNK